MMDADRVNAEVQRLLDLAAARSAARMDGSWESNLHLLSTLELHAFLVAGGIRLRRCDRPVDVLQRQALTLLVLLGEASGYEFGHGATRVVIIGRDAVWKLALNSHGDSISDIEARAAISAPVAPARWRTVAGIRVLEMERVEVVDPDDLGDDELAANPWWTDVDGWLFGRRQSGELVVFDAGQFGPGHRMILPDRYRARLPLIQGHL